MPAFDINSPSPDAGHEAIRLAVLQAIADLASTENKRGQLQTRVTTLETQVQNLTTRLAVLEAAAAPPLL